MPVFMTEVEHLEYEFWSLAGLLYRVFLYAFYSSSIWLVISFIKKRLIIYLFIYLIIYLLIYKGRERE